MYKQTIEDGKGNIIEVREFRTLEQAKAGRKAIIRQQCEAAILAVAPYFKQCNAGLGILKGEEAAEIIEAITTNRDRCNELEALIDAADTHDDVDAISW